MKLVAAILSVVAFALVLAGCQAESPPMTIGPLPLTLRTQDRYFDACNDALLQPVRFIRVGEDAAFVSAATGEPVEIIWPKDFRARLVNGRAELLDSFGVTVAVENDVLDNVGGSGDPWNACSIGSKYYR